VDFSFCSAVLRHQRLQTAAAHQRPAQLAAAHSQPLHLQQQVWPALLLQLLQQAQQQPPVR
jgi:hypothetical protein